MWVLMVFVMGTGGQSQLAVPGFASYRACFDAAEAYTRRIMLEPDGRPAGGVIVRAQCAPMT